VTDRRFSLLVGLWALLFHGALLAFGGMRVLGGRFADSDCYVRLMRVTRLFETGGWYDGFEPLLNAPDGLVMHWTRPFDVLLLLMALPGLVVTDFATSLHWAAIVISPVLAAVTLGFLAWGALAVMPRWGVAIMAVLFVTEPGVYATFQLGRPDHHSLHLALAAATLALMARWVASPQQFALAAWAGLAVALSLWVGTEALLILFIAMAGFGILWLIVRNQAAVALWRFTLVFALGVAAAIAVERPPGAWLATEPDRISLVHAVLAAAMVAAAGVIAVVARRRPDWGFAPRVGVACCAALIPALAMVVGFPAFFDGPYGAVAPEVREVFLANVREAQPLLSRGASTWSEAIFALGPVAFAVPFAAWRIWRGAAVERGTYIILLLALVVYIAGALYQIRLMPYGELILVWLWAAVLVAVVRAVPRMGSRPWNGAAGALAIFTVLIGHVVVAASLRMAEPDQGARDDEAACDWQAAAGTIRELAPEGTILSYIYPGPELAWRTGLGVVAAPYHRNEAGIVDADGAFLAPPEEARAVIDDRRVGLIVLCLVERGRGGHDWYVDAGGPGSLYGRLASGQPPAWATRIGEDNPGFAGFMVFSVDRNIDLP